MIRNAQIADLPRIANMIKRLLPQTPYASLPFDLTLFGQTFGQCISSALGFAVVSEKDGELDGIMLAAAQPLWFTRGRQATDFVTYAERSGVGYFMIKRFLDWAWTVPNVVEVTLAQSSGIDIERTIKLYERAGLKRVGSIFTILRPVEEAEKAA